MHQATRRGLGGLLARLRLADAALQRQGALEGLQQGAAAAQQAPPGRRLSGAAPAEGAVAEAAAPEGAAAAHEAAEGAADRARQKSKADAEKQPAQATVERVAREALVASFAAQLGLRGQPPAPPEPPEGSALEAAVAAAAAALEVPPHLPGRPADPRDAWGTQAEQYRPRPFSEQGEELMERRESKWKRQTPDYPAYEVGDGAGVLFLALLHTSSQRTRAPFGQGGAGAAQVASLEARQGQPGGRAGLSPGLGPHPRGSACPPATSLPIGDLRCAPPAARPPARQVFDSWLLNNAERLQPLRDYLAGSLGVRSPDTVIAQLFNKGRRAQALMLPGEPGAASVRGTPLHRQCRRWHGGRWRAGTPRQPPCCVA